MSRDTSAAIFIIGMVCVSIGSWFSLFGYDNFGIKTAIFGLVLTVGAIRFERNK